MTDLNKNDLLFDDIATLETTFGNHFLKASSTNFNCDCDGYSSTINNEDCDTDKIARPALTAA